MGIFTPYQPTIPGFPMANRSPNGTPTIGSTPPTFQPFSLRLSKVRLKDDCSNLAPWLPFEKVMKGHARKTPLKMKKSPKMFFFKPRFYIIYTIQPAGWVVVVELEIAGFLKHGTEAKLPNVSIRIADKDGGLERKKRGGCKKTPLQWRNRERDKITIL